MNAPNWLPLHTLLASERPGDTPVSHDGERFITWKEFAGRAVALAHSLRRRPETRWLPTGDDPLSFAIELFALLYAGKQAVILPNMRPGTLAALSGAFDARIDSLKIAGDAPKNLAPIDPRTAIIELYTSGSSGEHKRVRKTLAQFEAEAAVLESLWGKRIGASALVASVPPQHIYGLLFRLFWPLASGRAFDAVTCTDPEILRRRLAFFGSAALISSPAQLARLPEGLSLAELNPKPVAVFSSGSPLSADAAQTLADALIDAPIEIFGSTETGGVAWRQQARGADGDAWTPFLCHTISCSAQGALTLRSPFLADDGLWEMDDGIALLPDGRFRLLGRLDRVVKIEEKRLSLPEMEARLSAHPWVEAAALTLLSGRRQHLGAVLALSEAGRERLRADGRRPLIDTLRRELAGYFDAVLLPRRWRFPDRLPFDERGKLPAAALAALFTEKEVEFLLPEVLTVDSDALCRAELLLRIDPKIAHFAGHFPGTPILPGIVQLDWAIRFARQHLPLQGDFSSLENLKFVALVQPGDELCLSLAWNKDARRLDFSYERQGKERKFSSGRVLFSSPID